MKNIGRDGQNEQSKERNDGETTSGKISETVTKEEDMRSNVMQGIRKEEKG